MPEPQFPDSPQKLLNRSAEEAAPPSSTYRLQLSARFPFDAVAELADYLGELGVSHVYASPIFETGSVESHGYDIADFNQLNRHLGGRSSFEQLVRRLRECGLGLILDWVPNHMGIQTAENRWWMDVLESGPGSTHAQTFDIDWEAEGRPFKNKVLLPILEDHYGKVLENGKLGLAFQNGQFSCRYYDRAFPLAFRTCAEILRSVAKRSKASQPQSVDAIEKFIAGMNPAPASVAAEDFEKFKRQLAKLAADLPEIAAGINSVLADLNGVRGQPESFDRLDAVLEQQFYRLAFWRTGPQEMNYRRFFDVTGLAGVRMELPEVFRESHQLIFELLQAKLVDGLRIDHPDGLWDPEKYLFDLQREFLKRALLPRSEKESEAACEKWINQRKAVAGAAGRWPLYVTVEKILAGPERLPRSWPVAGTTGYDFLNDVAGIFVDQRNEKQFDRIYQAFTGLAETFETAAAAGKRRTLEHDFAVELEGLARGLHRLAAKTRVGRDLTLAQCRRALIELTVGLPVYRLYFTRPRREVAADAAAQNEWVAQGIGAAQRAAPELPEQAWQFAKKLLLHGRFARWTAREVREAERWLGKWQQLTGPAMAKGVEDTAFYRYNRLLALNEVGGNPGQFGRSSDEFHERNLARASAWPHTMLATSTHDAKRGEDVRMRLAVLSEMPSEWAAAIERWSRFNAGRKTKTGQVVAPSANDEYFLYQTLVGAWPFSIGSDEAWDEFRRRISEAMLKSIREAKLLTSWIDPNPAYETATRDFIDAILDRNTSAEFLQDIGRFQKRVAFFGVVNSLAQLLLKATAPGVPDFYQGSELWDLNLVDPDNRRPVDFDARRKLLRDLREFKEQPDLQRLLNPYQDGAVKLFLTRQLLGFRREQRALFSNGTYVGLSATGPKAEHVCAFAREWQNQTILAVAPRLVATLLAGRETMPLGREVWGETSVNLPKGGGDWRNVVTGEPVTPGENATAVPLAIVLKNFPVALLERQNR